MLAQGRPGYFLITSAVVFVVVAGPVLAIGSCLYGTPTLAPLNIVLYNVLSSEASSELYGVEPPSFHLLNGFPNFNLGFVLALASPVIALLPRGLSRAGWCLAPLFCWLGVFLPQPHKEERFLPPAHPLICLAAAVALGPPRATFEPLAAMGIEHAGSGAPPSARSPAVRAPGQAGARASRFGAVHGTS